MAGYRVVPEELDEAADAAVELAEQGGSIDVAGAVGQAPAALSGSRAEGKLRALAGTMRDQLAGLTKDTRTYAGNLSNAAAHYRANEQQASEALDGVAGDSGPR